MYFYISVGLGIVIINAIFQDFIELASKWACVQSSSIVRLYGVTLSSPTAMVLEYLPYGPFDVYLRYNLY